MKTETIVVDAPKQSIRFRSETETVNPPKEAVRLRTGIRAGKGTCGTNPLYKV